MKSIRILFSISLLLYTFIVPFDSIAQKSKKSKKNEKPDWILSRPVDRNYYQGIGVAMVNTYTQGHVEEAKKKALNDLISEISVSIKSTSLMQQIEQNQELNSMYQSQTQLKSENEIEGYELVDSWGDEKEYWVYYRLSKQLYNSNKQRKLDRAKGLGSQYYESGKDAYESGDLNQAYSDFVKGLVAIKDYLDADLPIATDKGKEHLADAIFFELVQLNRDIKITSNVDRIKARIGKAVDQEITITTKYQEWPVSLSVKPIFTKGSGELPTSLKTDKEGKVTFKIQRVTGGDNQQVLEVTPDIEAFTAESEGQDLMARLIRLKASPPSCRINVEANKILATVVLEGSRLGEPITENGFAKSIKNRLTEQVFALTENPDNAEVRVTIMLNEKKGEEMPLRNHTLYTSFVDLYVSVIEISSGKQVLYKGFSDEKGSRSGSFEKALQAAEESALIRFEEEILPEVGNLDL